MAWGSFGDLMVVLAAVFVVGPFTRGVFGVMVVVGWAVPVRLFVFVEGEDDSGGECMSMMASHTVRLLLGLADGVD